MSVLKSKLYRLLRWSEKYTKTDMVYLVSGGFWLTTTKGIALLASLATSIAFANLLDPTVYGTYRYILSVLPILVIPTLSGIDIAITRAVAQGKESTVYPALSLKISWGIWGAAAAITVAAYYWIQGNLELGTLFLLAAASIPFMEPYNLYVAILNGLKDFKRQTYYGIIVRTIPSFALICTVFITGNIYTILVVYFLSYTLTRYGLLKLTLKRIPNDGPNDINALRFGKDLSLMSILTTVAGALDSILLFHFTGPAALAGYTLSVIPYKQVLGLFSNLNTLALPKLSVQNKNNVAQTLPKKIWRSYAIVVPAVLIYVILAPLLFSLLYPKYLALVYVSDFFMLRLLYFPLSIFTAALTAQGQTKYLYISSISTALARIVLLAIFIPLFGVWGAALAIMIAGIYGSLIGFYLFFRAHN